MESKFISIKEVANMLKISSATVNYYTNLGLLKVADRKGNKRLYNKNDIINRFEQVKQLRRQGYSLGLIQQKLNSKPVMEV